jgi:hypothetical protein
MRHRPFRIAGERQAQPVRVFAPQRGARFGSPRGLPASNGPSRGCMGAGDGSAGLTSQTGTPETRTSEVATSEMGTSEPGTSEAVAGAAAVILVICDPGAVKVSYSLLHQSARWRHEIRQGRGHHGRRTVMLEFPSMEAIRALRNSPGHVPVKELRQGAAIPDIRAVPGA